ncbi:MAG TPA: hypothetical protein PLI45_00725 [Candidatus Woesebacteria bacterium]|nr:hypothetical protein [Candidatus Woesebacteria bacterium]
MAQNKIVGYKNIFGFVLPDWVDESLIRMIVTVLMLSVVMLFVLFFVVWPKLDSVEELRSTLKEETASLSLLKSSQEGFNKLNEQIPENLQEMVLSAIPQTYSPEKAIFLLRRIANDTGVSITSYKLPSGVVFSTDESKQGTGGETMVDFANFPIRISVSAPVNSLLLFIDKIESSLPYGVVSDLNMQEVTKLVRTSAGSVNMDLEIKYFQSTLKKVDITKIGSFTGTDLDMVKQMATFSRYNLDSDLGNMGQGSVTTTTNIFGF